MVQLRIVHSEFPETEVLVTVEDAIIARLILLKVTVEEVTLELCKLLPVAVMCSTVDDPILDLVHTELIIRLSLMSLSVSVEPEQSEFLT